LGGYAPGGLYEAIWQLPGMNVQRAPGRFLMIAGLSLAMLAAFGAQWLVNSARVAFDEARRGRRLLVMHIGVLAVLGGLMYALITWRAWLESNRSLAMQAAAQVYLSLSHDGLGQLKPIDVVLGLESSLDLANPKTQLPLLILGAFAVLLVLWRELPRLRMVWPVALVLLVAADLVVFASDFHPLVDVAQLGNPGPAGQMLIDRAGGWRVLTRPEVDVPQPNELLPHNIAEASGYSPLQLERHRWYAESVQTVDDVLLDLWSVRWIVETSRPEPMPSYQLVSFHPRRPLMIGGAGTPNGEIRLTPEPRSATSVRIISALSGGEAIPDGEVVGECLLTDTEGARYVLPMRAGREIADWRPRAAGLGVAHRPIQQATTISLGERGTERVLGYAELLLPRRLTVASLEYRHLNSAGRSLLYGVGLYDRVEDSTAQVTREDRYQVAYQDESTTVYENSRAYPRAFVVPEAVLVPDGPAAMARLRDGPLDPRSQVVVESRPASGSGPFQGTRPVDAAIVAEGTGVVDVRASAPGGGFLVLTDPYYPGWRAYVDGVESPILRADYLFRAVELPPGSHEIRFVFLPDSLQRGAWLTAVGVTIAVGAVLVGIGGLLVTQRPWRRRPLRRRRAEPTEIPHPSDRLVE
jgi:hypothetical protein